MIDMSITATFYSFSKRVNSTKLPSGGTDYNILIKEPSNILNPTIVLDRGNPASLNYCYIPTFNRYYWVEDWTSDHGLWVAQCKVDPLASWRSSILASEQYVVRCGDPGNYDTYLPDNVYHTRLRTTTSQVEPDTQPFTHNETVSGNPARGWHYIIGVVNNKPDAKIGGVNFYALDQTEFNNFVRYMMLDPTYLSDDWSLLDIGKDLMRALVNPTSYITYSARIPYRLVAFTQPSDPSQQPSMTNLPKSAHMTFGWWDLQDAGYNDQVAAVPGMYSHARVRFYSGLIDIPKNHPDHVLAGSWVLVQPYTQYTLYAGPFGYIQLDGVDLVSESSVYIELWGDLFGNVLCKVMRNSDKAVIYQAEKNLSIPVNISYLTVDTMNYLKNAVSGTATAGTTAFGAASKSAGAGDIAGGITKVGGNVASAFEMMYPKPSSSGGVGGAFSSLMEPWYIQAEYHELVDLNKEDYGMPTCKRLTLNSIIKTNTSSGFCLCSEPDIEIPATSTENDAIKSYLSSGCFIE